MLAGFSFYTLFYVYSAAVLPISFFYLKKTRLFSLKTETSIDYRVIIIISVLALAGALLSLLSIRPDADDVNYLSRAVYYFENPRVPLDFEFHNHAPAGFDFRSLLFTFPVIELFWTYLAMVFNVHPLGVYHFAAPALGGAMIPLAWFLLLSKFTDNQKAAALGTAVIMAYLCVDGITHRSFGSFAFGRIWQGKGMVLAIVLPLLAAYSLDFLSNSKSRGFVKLAMLGIAAVGLAYTAFFIYPFMVLLLGFAYVIAYGKEARFFKVIPVYFVSIFYVFISAIIVLIDAKRAGKAETLNEGWPISLSGIMDFVFGGYFTFSSMTLYASAILVIILLKGVQRRFIIRWLIFTFLFFLNPITGELVAKNLTSPNAYWRLLYLLPFPLLPGLVVVSVFEKTPAFDRFLFPLFSAIIAFAVLFNFVPNKISVFGKVDFGLRYKLDQQIESDVREMLAVALDGPMLSPVIYSSVIPLFTSRLPQVAVRIVELEFFAAVNGQQAAAKKRVEAVRFVSGDNSSQNFQSLAEVTRENISTVVLEKYVAGLPETIEVMKMNGFRLMLTGRSFVLYSKYDATS